MITEMRLNILGENNDCDTLFGQMLFCLLFFAFSNSIEILLSCVRVLIFFDLTAEERTLQLVFDRYFDAKSSSRSANMLWMEDFGVRLHKYLVEVSIAL